MGGYRDVSALGAPCLDEDALSLRVEARTTLPRPRLFSSRVRLVAKFHDHNFDKIAVFRAWPLSVLCPLRPRVGLCAPFSVPCFGVNEQLATPQVYGRRKSLSLLLFAGGVSKIVPSQIYSDLFFWWILSRLALGRNLWLVQDWEEKRQEWRKQKKSVINAIGSMTARTLRFEDKERKTIALHALEFYRVCVCAGWSNFIFHYFSFF